MAWTSPMTFVDNNVLTAAQLNTHLRDNMMELAPAKATTNAGAWYIAQGPNKLEERLIKTNRIFTAQSTKSSGFVDLDTIGPSVTVNTGVSAIVMLSTAVGNTVANNTSSMGYSISGRTTKDATSSQSLIVSGRAAAKNMQYGITLFAQDLTPGENTFTAKYSAGADTSTFSNRFIGVIPF